LVPGVGVAAQPGQGVGDADVELGGDHAGGLVDDPPEGDPGQPGGQGPGGGVGLDGEDGVGDEVGHGRGVDQLGAGEGPGPDAVEVHGADLGRPGPEREGVDGG